MKQMKNKQIYEFWFRIENDTRHMLLKLKKVTDAVGVLYPFCPILRKPNLT